MPLILVYTNISPDTTDFCKNMSKLVSKLLGVEEKILTVHLVTGQNMVQNGTDEPIAYVYLYFSKGFGTIEKKREISKEVLDYVKKHLNIPSGRTFLVFKSPASDNIALEDGILSDFD